MCYEPLQPRIRIVEVMEKFDQKLTILAAHFSDQANERQRQWRLVLQRATSFKGHFLTLCDHNSLLFPTSEALHQPLEDAPAVLAAWDLEFRWPRDSSLHSGCSQIHPLPDDREKSFASPLCSTRGFLGQANQKNWRVAGNDTSIRSYHHIAAAIRQLHISQEGGHTGRSSVGIGFVCAGLRY